MVLLQAVIYMNDDELLLSVLEDKAEECDRKSVITCTDFLDLRKQSLAVNYLKRRKDIKWCLYGGYDDAERKMVVFIPFYIDDFQKYISENKDENPLCVFRADKDGFSKLSHRDYLGAITGLGIKREKTGDIIIDEKGCYFFAKHSISKFIAENFSQAGRGTLSVSVVDLTDDFKYTPNVKEKCCFIQSMRLDSVCSAVFSVSRSKASEFIEKGLVFLNDEQIFKPDYRVSVGQKLVIKGKGRAFLKDDSGKSKKDRIALIVDVFI